LEARARSIEVTKNARKAHGELHKKTYFQALEKMLASPINKLKSTDASPNSMNLLESQSRAFDDVFKRPPSNLQQK
jgi:hypothetical protein